MTNEEAIKILESEWRCIDRNDGINCDRNCENCDLVMDASLIKDAYNMAIKALEQQSCEDCISREAVLDELNRIGATAFDGYNDYSEFYGFVDTLPPVTPQPKVGKTTREEYEAIKTKLEEKRQEAVGGSYLMVSQYKKGLDDAMTIITEVYEHERPSKL